MSEFEPIKVSDEDRAEMGELKLRYRGDWPSAIEFGEQVQDFLVKEIRSKPDFIFMDGIRALCAARRAYQLLIEPGGLTDLKPLLAVIDLGLDRIARTLMHELVRRLLHDELTEAQIAKGLGALTEEFRRGRITEADIDEIEARGCAGHA